MSYFLGIDLGTTYTAAAVAREGRVEILTLGTRAADIPSVVFMRDDESMLVGDAAGRRGISEPSRVAREFKRRFGDPTPISLAGSSITADSLWGKLLAWVLETVTTSQGGTPAGVAITHPANWGPYKLELMAEEIRLAGIPNPATLSEPEAAAIAYAASNRVEPGDTVAVYDLGGGTFDAAVLRRTEKGFELIGTPEGIERLGGIDVDEAVFAHVVDALGSNFEDLDPDDAAAMAAVARLRQECVAAKEVLSQDTEVSIPVMLPNHSAEVRLTRAELEAMIRPTLLPTVEALTRAVASAGLEPADLRAVLLVGGSSRMPLVGQMVSAALGVPVVTDAHPKYSVALGAARLAENAAAPGAPSEIVVAEQTETEAPPVVPKKKKKKPAAPPVPAPEPEQSADEAESEETSAPPTPPAPAEKEELAAAAVTETPDIESRSAEPAPVSKSSPSLAGIFKERLKTRKMVLIPILTLIALLLGGQAFLSSEAEGSQDEVFLAPKEAPGENAFTPAINELPPGSVIPDVLIPAAATGTDPALYAGTRGSTSCRTEALVTFLEAPENAARRTAWASVAGVAETDIRPYVASLTPAWTRADARITEFVLKDGKAAPRQTVLEAGSAVLLDRTGFPRVRCVSGSPLDRARRPPGPPKFVGPKWQGFDETTLVVISPGAPAEVITLFDPVTGQSFDRLPGSVTIIDIDTRAPGTPLTVVEPGQQTTITGALWPPGSVVTIRFDTPPDILGLATADAAGSFSQSVNIPESSRPGIHQVTMEGSGFTVTQPAYVIPRGVRVVRVALPGSLEEPKGPSNPQPVDAPRGEQVPEPAKPASDPLTNR